MKIELFVDGMSCEHCKKAVENAAKSVDGVVSAEVNLKEKKVVILGENPNVEKIREAIEDQGYDIIK